jgi:hypothetical protein
MTKREVIRECKKLWKEIEKSGLGKSYFLKTPAGLSWEDKGYNNDCPLCNEYHPYMTGKVGCGRCPLVKQYINKVAGYDRESDCICYDLGFNEDKIPSEKWLSYIKGLKE